MSVHSVYNCLSRVEVAAVVDCAAAMRSLDVVLPWDLEATLDLGMVGTEGCSNTWTGDEI